jgi:hypothetical protein
MKNKPSANSRLARLRILWKIHVCVSQEILSLTENNRLRSSQPRQAAKRQVVKKRHFQYNFT